MPKCPHCKKEIETAYAEGHATGYLTKDEDVIDQDVEWVTYTCPECQEELFESSSSDVAEFLGKGKFPNPDAITDLRRWWF